MRRAEVLWAPHPYRAGFCVTDDTDAATLGTVRAVYDLLVSIGLRTTKTVWAFEPSEPCGIPALPASILRGVTLEEPDYFRYCQMLGERGFEICLHGASAGNNVRARTLAALDLLDRHFGPVGTFICHAKNAENPYWHERVAPKGLAQTMLAPLSRYRCSGEDPASPYYWGDVCRERVRHIRLFRTREVNTLARNPSMPYHDVEKPLVRSWFAATKRSFHDCTRPEALDALRSEHGLCVLYQYLHRYADPRSGGVSATFRSDAERLMGASDILVDTVSVMMDRLRLVHGVFLAWRYRELWVVNANDVPVRDLQLRVPARLRWDPPAGMDRHGEIVRVASLDARRAIRLALDEPVAIPADRAIPLDEAGHGVKRLERATIHLNVGDPTWARETVELKGGHCDVEFDPDVRDLRPLSTPGPSELAALLVGQLGIMAREFAWKGRSLNTREFLSGETIALEDHSNW